jgi:hypothetical protein
VPDDFDSVVADRCRAVDDVPVPGDMWSRVQLKVRDRAPVQFSEEETTMIDLEAPSHADEYRKGPKRMLVAALLAAAAVVAIALVAIYDGDPASPADQPAPTVTTPPTLPPQPLFPSMDEQDLGPGTHFVDEVGGIATPRIFLTLGEGWRSEGGGLGITHPELGVVVFHRLDPTRVYVDACHASEGMHPGPLTTVDDVVAALSEQAGWVSVTAPSDISVNGYPGKTFQRTAPADFTGCNPGRARFRSWSEGWWYEPNEIETLRIYDVNGSIIVINARMPEESVPAVAAVLDSIRIAQA